MEAKKFDVPVGGFGPFNPELALGLVLSDQNYDLRWASDAREGLPLSG